jgi:hypothetical protein
LRELYNGNSASYIYSSPDIIRIIKSRIMGWTEHAACSMAEMRLVDIWVGKPEGKTPLTRPKHRPKANPECYSIWHY